MAPIETIVIGLSVGFGILLVLAAVRLRRTIPPKDMETVIESDYYPDPPRLRLLLSCGHVQWEPLASGGDAYPLCATCLQCSGERAARGVSDS